MVYFYNLYKLLFNIIWNLEKLYYLCIRNKKVVEQ